MGLGLRARSYEIRDIGYGFRVMGYGFKIMGYGFRVVGIILNPMKTEQQLCTFAVSPIGTIRRNKNCYQNQHQ